MMLEVNGDRAFVSEENVWIWGSSGRSDRKGCPRSLVSWEDRENAERNELRGNLTREAMDLAVRVQNISIESIRRRGI